MNRPLSSTLSNFGEKRLSAYALASLAGIGAVTATQVAQAAIVQGNTGTLNAGNSPFTLFTGGPALTLLSFSDSGSHVRSVGGASTASLKTVSNFAANLSEGTRIGPGGSSVTPNVPASASDIGKFVSGSGQGNFVNKKGYLGFSFTDPNNSAQTDYGWARIVENSNLSQLTIDGDAYDNTGSPIAAGAVPEPGSLGLLAGGAAALAAWRLRTAKRKEAAGGDEDAGVVMDAAPGS